jgi:hypothetical protein
LYEPFFKISCFNGWSGIRKEWSMIPGRIKKDQFAKVKESGAFLLRKLKINAYKMTEMLKKQACFCIKKILHEIHEMIRKKCTEVVSCKVLCLPKKAAYTSTRSPFW